MIFFDNVGRYREIFVGAGFEVRPWESLTIDHEWYYDQATGPDGHGKAWLQPWTRVELKLPHHVVSETVVFPYIPLNGGSTQFVLERSKLEYQGFKYFSFGGGYGAYKDFTYTDYLNRPFASVTAKTKKYGDFEFWIQAMPGSTFQIQVRHAIAWHSRH